MLVRDVRACAAAMVGVPPVHGQPTLHECQHTLAHARMARPLRANRALWWRTLCTLASRALCSRTFARPNVTLFPPPVQIQIKALCPTSDVARMVYHRPTLMLEFEANKGALGRLAELFPKQASLSPPPLSRASSGPHFRVRNRQEGAGPMRMREGMPARPRLPTCCCVLANKTPGC